MSLNKSVLPPKYSEGPHGLGKTIHYLLARENALLGGGIYKNEFLSGDPDDKSLRKVEAEVLIPKLIREKAKTLKCAKEVSEFEQCCKDSSLLMVVRCRDQNSSLKECLSGWYRNEEFKQMCTEEYLKERSEYRRTGIKKPMKRA